MHWKIRNVAFIDNLFMYFYFGFLMNYSNCHHFLLSLWDKKAMGKICKVPSNIYIIFKQSIIFNYCRMNTMSIIGAMWQVNCCLVVYNWEVGKVNFSEPLN